LKISIPFHTKLNFSLNSVPVRKGEQLTTTYTDILKTTLERRRHLKQTKIFECDCERCQDPSELSTYGSSWKCRKCNKGQIMSTVPLNITSEWHCNSCSSKYSHEVKFWEPLIKSEKLNVNKEKFKL
jgi:hypothetical protein